MYNSHSCLLADLTPPSTPEADVQMFNTYLNPIPNTAQPAFLNRKHKRQDSIDLEIEPVRSKRRLIFRDDDINDQTLLDISQAACSKYMDLGIRLGLPYTVITSTIGGVGSIKPEHLKMFYVLQEWKGRAANKFTFDVLSEALEDVGLASVAHNFCYADHNY